MRRGEKEEEGDAGECSREGERDRSVGPSSQKLLRVEVFGEALASVCISRPGVCSQGRGLSGRAPGGGHYPTQLVPRSARSRLSGSGLRPRCRLQGRKPVGREATPGLRSLSSRFCPLPGTPAMATACTWLPSAQPACSALCLGFPLPLAKEF